MEYVNYEDFKKMDMRIGWIRFIEPVEGTDKLLRFEIDFGALSEEELNNEEYVPAFGKDEYRGKDVRQIVSGIREYFPSYEELRGKKALYILNLEPREIRGVMSHGMLIAVDGLDGKPVFLTPEGVVEAGSSVR